jgi:hypothetical protein
MVYVKVFFRLMETLPDIDRYTNTCVLLPTSRCRLAQRKGWIMQMLATLKNEETLYFFYYSLIKAQIKSKGRKCNCKSGFLLKSDLVVGICSESKIFSRMFPRFVSARIRS